MAGIDKMYVRNHWEKDEFVVWCITHKPSLLNNLYEPFDGHEAWLGYKQFYAKTHEITNNDDIYEMKVPIADFRFKQDKYLYWHCPLDFVREYLETQCGYKRANWFVKLFWRY